MAKEKKINWTAIIIIVLILIFLLSTMGIKYDKRNSNIYNASELKEVIISGMNEVITITDTTPLKVYVTGMNAIVYFSKTSNPKEIYLNGMSSVVYLCEGVHNPSVEASGMNARAIYRMC